MAVTDSRASVEEEENGVSLVQTPDVDFLGQAPQGNFELFIDYSGHTNTPPIVLRLT
jgi:hypothetical protein